MKKKRSSLAAAVLAFCASPAAAAAAAAADPGGGVNRYKEIGVAFSAALTMSVCVLGAAYAVARIGAAAMGAATEKPELLMRSLMFVALAEGLAVLGFVIAMLMVGKM